MLNAPNAHGFCPRVVSQGGHPKTHKRANLIMEICDKYLLINKLEYLKLTLKISKLRYHGEEPDMDLLLEAQKIGRLAGIQDDELNNLLFNLSIQN